MPDKESETRLQCKICKGAMNELPKRLSEKLLGVFMNDVKNTRRYQCEDCHKELYIRER